jgi:hypothetical protein
MSDITLIDDSDQSSLVTNGLAKNGELYLKKAGSTDAGSIVVYDSGVWKGFANEASAGFANSHSLYFDGTGDLATCGDISAINSASNVTISCWIKADSFPNSTFNSIWGGGQAGGSGHPSRFWFNAKSSRLHIYNGTSQNFSFSTTVSTGTWYHTAVVISGSNNLSVYLNGSQLGSTVTTFNSLTSQSGDNFEIAGNPTYNPYFWDGNIDEFAVFNSALSATDVASLIDNSGSNPVPADISSLSPRVWLRMGENDDTATATTITNQGQTGSTNDGTLVNGAAFDTDVPS